MKQFLLFCVLAYSISWLIWLPLYGSAIGIVSLPIFPYHHAIGALGPLLAAFITTYIFKKGEGIKLLFYKCIKVRPILYLLIAAFAPTILGYSAILASSIIHNVAPNSIDLFTSKEFPNFSIPGLLVYNLLFFGFGEEVGWRGVGLPFLQTKMNALAASCVLTIVWAMWHIPLFFYRPGYMDMNVMAIVGWVLSLLTGSILLTWLHNSSKGSLLICALFHSTIDIAFTSQAMIQPSLNYLGFLITVWGVLTVIIFKAKKLSVFA